MTPQAIVRRTGVSVWRQIEDALSADILAGHLQARLPNEGALAERFCVNRHTVRQAVKALAERGLVEVQHGRGTFVRADVIDYQLGRRSRLAHSVASARRIGISRVLAWNAAPASAEVRQLLDLTDLADLADLPELASQPTPASVLCVDSLDVVDGKVIGVCTQYFPLPRFAGLGELYARTGVTHLALAEFGISHFQRRLSRVTASLPTKHVAQQLGQSAALPILTVETVYVDEAGLAIEYGISRFCSASVHVVMAPE
jgi:GntR family phosphonate transport system transcriptional regulator